MTSPKLLSPLVAFILSLTQPVFSQTGPGGVGNATGANGQPQNVLWLKSDAGITHSSGLVDGWADQSGNSNNAIGSGATRPTYNAVDGNFNGLSSLTFPNTAGNFFLEVPDNDNLDNTSNLSVFFVTRPTSASTTVGVLGKRNGVGVNDSYYFQMTSAGLYQNVIANFATRNITSVNTSFNQTDIISFLMVGSSLTGLLDGANTAVSVGPVSIPNNSSNLFVGTFDNSTTNNFEGQIVEVVIYRSALNTAQRQIVENYLSAKYNSTLTAGDLYTGDNAGGTTLNHDFDLAGIGFNGGFSHLTANSKGLILTPSAGTINVNGEFVLAAHNGVANSVVTSNLGTGGVVERWNRTWYIDRTPASGIDANITFDFSEGISGQFPQNKDNYVLLFRNTSTGNYDVVSAITNSDKTLVGDQLTFRVADANLVDGVYTIGTLNATTSPLLGTSNRTWYSYQSGDWTNPTSWTLDGGLFPLLVNPSSETPGLTDNVIVTSGKTITMNTSGVQVNSVDVQGTLDVVATTGHSFGSISGDGRIRISGAVDNFPSGTSTDFASASIGGTLEIYGTGISLDQARTFNDVEINMNGGSDVAILMNDFVINGDLTISNGLFKVNNDIAVVNRTLTIYGDLTIAPSGGLRVGNTNSRHELNLHGDFENNGGTAYFTQRVSAITGSDATDGIIDLNLVSSSGDQNVICDGVTRFYRIEINKGTDDTYKATLSASAVANFNLYGRANYDINEANPAANGNGSNLNALGLNYGTVEVGTNVVIANLNTTGNYSIYEGAQLWVNGGSVTKPSGTAIVPYGKVRVSSGTLTADINSGLTLRDDGFIEVDGGTLTAQAIRTSTNGASAVGGYIQSGGDVILTGGAVSDDYAVFSLTYTGNVFNMSGGTLTVQNRSSLGTGSLRGAIFINSDPSNISVTGGTVVMDADNAIAYRVTSRTSFWNVIVRATGGARVIELLGTTSGTGGGANEITLAIQPIIALNDFTIENNATFTTNNADVTIGGSLIIINGGAYSHGTNTTTMTGAGVGSLFFGNTDATQTFNNLTINKTNVLDEVVITSGNATAMRVNGTFTVSKGVFDYATFIVSARGTVTLSNGVTMGKSGSTGRLLLDGTVAQTLNSSGMVIYNLQLNNSGATPQVTLGTGDLTIFGTLTMTSGVFNIGINKLSLGGASSVLTGGPFSVTKMIQTSGNSSDGGLEMYVGANGAITYPLGLSGKYTPATAHFQSFSDNGLVRIVPVEGILQTVNLAGGTTILSYYWKVSYSNFTTLPTVSYQFVYDDSDIGGTEANYRPGKVTDTTPYTRSNDGATDDVIDASNTIVFNGATTTGTFPGAGFTLEAASYTAGQTNRFNGVLDTYYSVASGDWNTGANWSRNATSGGPPNVPTAGSVVVIQSTAGVGHRMNVLSGTITVAAVQFNAGIASPNSENVPRLQFWAAGTNNIGTVTGTGMISFDAPDAPVVNGDFGDFGANPDSYYLYFGGNATVTNVPTPIPNLMFESATYTLNQNVSVGTDLIVQGNGVLNPIQTVTIGRDLLVGYWLGGTFQMPGAAPAITVTVGRNIDFTQDPFGAPGNRNVTVSNPGVLTLENSLIVKGNILQGSSNTSVLDLYNGAANRPLASLEFQGTGTHSYSRTSTSVPDLYRIVCNKGTDISSTFTLGSTVTLNGPTNGTTKAITITNGLLILNNTGTYTLSSGGSDFSIPSTAGLQVSAGTVNMTTASTGMTLSGLLRISGGAATLDAGAGLNNYIEYSNSGTATIEVTSGTLTVGSQIRRNTTSVTGVLKYTQSNGTVIVGSRTAPTTSRGVFEVMNTGSQFNLTGGSFTVVQGVNSTTIPSLWLEPASYNLTGSTITIGNASTPSGVNSENIGIQSTVPLNNLTIAGSNNPVVKIYISPLTVGGNLIVNSSTTLNANGRDLTIGGNFTVDGSYVNGNNTTTFTNTAAAAISGATPLFSFYNVSKSGGGTLTISKDITINNDLKVLAGTASTGTFAVNLKGNALIDGTMTSTSGSGLIFSGASQQQLTRTLSGTGTLGIVTIGNSLGVIIPDGNGYNFNVTNNLRLQQGVFDIGGSLLTLGTSCLITAVNPFSVTNMIQTNSSFTDLGVRKQFAANSTVDFVFPVGQLTYSPVSFNFSSPTFTTGGTAPTITVRPANEMHPAIVDDDELPIGAGPEDFDDLQNALEYHWIINADNVANTFRSTMSLQYDQGAVNVTAPRTEADYIPARILSDANPTNNINKFASSDLDESLNSMSFSFSGVTDAGISGQYFAGVDLAIPDNVPVYTTIASGNVSDAIYTPAVPGGGVPRGATVEVSTGHTLTLNTASGSVSLYSVTINNGATVTIPTGSIGHRLGTLTGTGNLRLESNTSSVSLPAAVYDDFFSCAGGGLIFAGTGSYEILGGVTLVRNLTLEGAGTKSFPNNNLSICNDLVLNAGTLTNTSSRTISVLNDMLINSGTYNNLNGVLTITRDFTQAGGTFNGGTGGAKAIGRNLTVNAGTFTSGSGTTNAIQLVGNFSLNGAATFTGGTSSSTGLRFVFQGTTAQVITGTFTGTRKLNRLEINNTNGLTLTGNVEIDRELIFTSGSITPGTNQLTMSTNAVANPTIGKATSFVNGKLYKVVPTTGGFTFPIGKGTIWRPASVSSLSAAGDTWDAEYFYAPATTESIVNNLTPVAPILRLAAGEYWKISDGAAVGRTARIGLSWGAESDVSATLAQREALQVVVWNDGLTRWDNYGGTNFSAGHTQSRGTFNSSSSVSFSENIVTLGSTETANPLPVELLSFSGRNENGFNKLEWKTASELNNDYFELQRSGTGEEFTAVSIIQGKGTTNDLSAYTFIDEQPYAGKNYYRLKQVDFNGNFEYSNIILVTNESENVFNISVFPNPVSKEGSVIVRTLKDDEYEATVVIMDMTGKALTSYIINGAGSFEQSVDLSTWGEVGIYLVEMRQGSRRVFKRLMLN